MIYDAYGNQLLTAYDDDGNQLVTAYDVEGSAVYTSTPVTLRVMSYNCGQWITGGGSAPSTESESAVAHRALANAILGGQNADILCIQEYWGCIGSQSMLSILQQYFPYVQEVNPYVDYMGHAVCSKYPISNFSTTDNNGRYLDRFSITVGGREIEVFNTHLATSSAEAAKVAQAQGLCNIVSTYNRFILCGDFNTVCKSVNDEEYTTIMKQFIDAGFHSANCSEQHGFIDTWTDGKTVSGTWYPCDQIITSANITIESVWVDTTKLTDGLAETIDHLPILADLQIN